jgi:hypothetical protein
MYIHYNRNIFTIPEIIEYNERIRRRGEPVGHTTLLEIPGTCFGQWNEIIGFQINKPQKCRFILIRKLILNISFKYSYVSLISAPRINPVITCKQMFMITTVICTGLLTSGKKTALTEFLLLQDQQVVAQIIMIAKTGFR